jgi:hypothetical protein
VQRLLLVALAGLALAPAAHAGGPGMVVGGAEDAVKQETIVTAKAKLDLLRLAGLHAVRVTSIWAPGERAPTGAELQRLASVAGAAKLTATDVYVAVMNFGSRTTPLSDTEQADFAAYTAAIARRFRAFTNFIVGNEPNLNRFWLPQFGPDGSNVAAVDYERLLARTYDTLKAVSPSITVIGGALSPRGGDRPGGIRPTHSPTAFITDMGTAYRTSGRAQPIMDAFAIHPYEDNSSLPPSFTHPRTTTIAIADYEKLVGLLSKAFDGTAQAGSTLPIVYAEFGVEAQIPSGKVSLYTGSEPATTKPVDEATQGRFYREAIAIAFCQPNVRAIFILHAIDERDLDRWQSGMYYVDESPKASIGAVREAARDSRGGVIASCPGLQVTPKATVVYPSGRALRAVPLTIRVTCDVDCNIYARLERSPRGSATLAVSAKAQSGTPTLVEFPSRRVAPGEYRFTVRLTAPRNTGAPAVLRSEPVVIPSS